MTAIASEPIHLSTHPAPRNRVAIDIEEGVRRADAVDRRTRAVALNDSVGIIGRAEDRDVTVATWSWTTLMDGALLLGVVWSIPIAMLAVGIPIALGITLLLWLVQLALGAF